MTLVVCLKCGTADQVVDLDGIGICKSCLDKSTPAQRMLVVAVAAAGALVRMPEPPSLLRMVKEAAKRWGELERRELVQFALGPVSSDECNSQRPAESSTTPTSATATGNIRPKRRLPS